MNYQIRRALPEDGERLSQLLKQVHQIHYQGRPDIFKSERQKYTPTELSQIIADDQRPIFVAVGENDIVSGYAMCILREVSGHSIMKDIKTLYLDDLCVDKEQRGKGIGKALFTYVKGYAAQQGCRSFTLNVWEFNQDAVKFYEKMGMTTQRRVMETDIS